MAAAAEGDGDAGGVVAGDGADGELDLAVAALAQGGGQADSGHGAGEAGNIIHIVPGDAHLLLHRPGDGADAHAAAPQQLHMVHDPALHFQPGQGVGLEQVHVQLIDPGPGPGAGGGGGEGMGGGIGIAEAAGVGGGPHVDGLGDLLIQRAAQQGQQVIDDLRAAGAVRVHQLEVGEAGGAAVVIDAQPDAAQKGLKVLRQHIGGGHVHADDAVAGGGLSDSQAPVQPAVAGGDLFVFQHMGRLAHGPQPQAQGGGGADGVTVRPGVGEDQVAVVRLQKIGGLSSRQDVHRRSPGN